MSRYRIVESVGSRVERVRDYDDLEIHHPSHRGREPGRTYADVNGNREEVLRERSRSGQHLVSKDFVLQDADRPGGRVRVPAPVEGVIGRIDVANGRVDIYDRDGGELLTRIRHMDLRGSALEVGDRVRYGQLLGWQSGFGGGRPDRYGVHVHMDFNAAHLDRFDRYLRDMDQGVLRPDGLPKGVERRASEPIMPRRPRSNAVLEEGSEGEQVEQLQRALARLGYHDASGRALAADGDFGKRTREAVEAFQRERGLDVDGRVGRDTLAELAKATAQGVSEPSHPRHALYRQALDAISHLERTHGLPAGPHSERIAGAMCACAAREGLMRIDRIELSHDRSLVRAVEVSGVRDEPGLNRSTQPVSTVVAAQQALATSSESLAADAARDRIQGTEPERRPVALSV